MSAVHPRTCKRCREGFTPARKWQEFCSDKCRVRFFVEEREAEQARRNKLIDDLEEENRKLLAQVQALQSEVERLRNQ